MKKSTYISLLFLMLFSTVAFGQETVLSAGGEASGSGSVSYSVGQVLYTTNTGTNGSVAKGVQQPYEISIITSVDNVTDTDMEINVFPNPVTNNITLDIENLEQQKLTYTLYNLQGKTITRNQLTGNSTTIKMEDLPKATYFLKITDNNTVIKTIRIIKN